jgi:hypothetical protein
MQNVLSRIDDMRDIKKQCPGAEKKIVDYDWGVLKCFRYQNL